MNRIRNVRQAWLVIAAVLSAVAPLGALTTKTWVGGNSNDDTFAANNWSDLKAPANNGYTDTALFKDSATTKTPSNSAALTISGFSFTNSVGWLIAGAAIKIDYSGAQSTGAGTNTIANLADAANTTISVGTNNVLVVSAGFVCNNRISVSGPGTLRVNGTYSGPFSYGPRGVQLNSGTLEVANSANAMNCLYVTGSGLFRYFANNVMTDSGYYVGVAGNGLIDVNGYSDTIPPLFVGSTNATAGTGGQGGGRVDIGSGYLNTSSNFLKAGTITTAANGTNGVSKYLWCQAAATGSVVQGNLRLTAAANSNVLFVVDHSNSVPVDFEVDGGIGEVPGTRNGLTKLGAGWMSVNGSCTYSLTTTVAAGTLVVTGLVQSVVVSNSATFGGPATVRSNLTVLGGATLAPGDTNGAPMTVSAGLTALGATARLAFTARPATGYLKLTGGALAVTAPVQVVVSLQPGCPPGEYPVLDAAAASGTLQAGDFTLSGTPANLDRCQLVVESRVLKLVVGLPGSIILLR